MYSRGRLGHGAELRLSCPANRCSGRGGSFDRARDQRRLKARAMCSVRNEASSEWRANLRMRFIKRKSLETGQKSASRKRDAVDRRQCSDLREPRFWPVTGTCPVSRANQESRSTANRLFVAPVSEHPRTAHAIRGFYFVRRFSFATSLFSLFQP
jgi:hypothetical protein